jgi:CHAT domain-containing protein
LRYIPLAALHDGNQWLAERYRINHITARSLTNFATPVQSRRRLLAAAFVQGTYEFEVSQRQFAFSGLPFAGKEVEMLTALVPNATKLIDKAFGRDAILPKLNEYSIVHFATHAAFVSGQPEDSFILFGNGDRATLREIETWSLQNVDLVVLSACETGLGGNLGNGEEILGLGYQFQRAGARATVASLWAVDDGGTQVLMNAFYAALNKGMGKSQALQEAQKALITGDYTTVGGDRSGLGVVPARTDQSMSGEQPAGDSLNHPYYWAPFILIGNGL